MLSYTGSFNAYFCLTNMSLVAFGILSLYSLKNLKIGNKSRGLPIFDTSATIYNVSSVITENSLYKTRRKNK